MAIILGIHPSCSGILYGIGPRFSLLVKVSNDKEAQKVTIVQLARTKAFRHPNIMSTRPSTNSNASSSTGSIDLQPPSSTSRRHPVLRTLQLLCLCSLAKSQGTAAYLASLFFYQSTESQSGLSQLVAPIQGQNGTHDTRSAYLPFANSMTIPITPI